jgi:hypothetical protein
MKRFDLICEDHVAGIHLDFDDDHNLSIGINTRHELIVQQEYGVLSRLDYRVYAVVSADETFRLARKLKLKISELPGYLSHTDQSLEFFEDEKIEALFQDILDELVDLGVHYVLKRDDGDGEAI